MTQPTPTGTLYIVATPIGNRSDWSQRAQDTLSHVSLIACEDTRHSGQLLAHYTIRTPLTALHDHNEAHRIASLIERLQSGDDIALISDAGTPLISDPGYRLVRAAHQANIKVVPIPGACAAISALSAAGLPSDRFCFEGFLPAKRGNRRQTLAGLAHEQRTLIFYESPHRIVEALHDLSDSLGPDREATLAREITKTFETIRHSTLGDLAEWVAQDPNQQKGEMVLIVAGNNADQSADAGDSDRLLTRLIQELPLKQAAQIVADVTGQAKNAVYDRALALKAARQDPPR